MDIQKLAQEMAERAQKEQGEKIMEAMIKLNSASYSSMMAYTNLINVAGYAAIFAVWNLTKDQLTKFTMQYVAILVLISLAFFIGFELYRMVLNALESQQFSNAVLAQVKEDNRPAPLLKTIEKYQKGQQRRAVLLMRVWQPVIFTAVGSGLAAGVILIVSFVQNLLAAP